MGMQAWMLFGSLSLVAILGSLWVARRARRWTYLEDEWSIGILRGDNHPILECALDVPIPVVLSSSSVTDARATFVADPFLVKDEEQWWMFFEVMDADARRGVVAVARSSDARSWTYDRIVLRESFHLSYPQVIAADGRFFMIPESVEARSVRLYRCDSFPYQWSFEMTLLEGAYLDPTVFAWNGYWWMFVQTVDANLELYYAVSLRGPWLCHPRNPIVRCDQRTSRPAGRVVLLNGKPVRFAQDCRHTYGERVVAFTICELTVSEYREAELPQSQLLVPSGAGWNSHGMHHVDAQLDSRGRWVAAVDGKRIVRRFSGSRFAADVRSIIN